MQFDLKKYLKSNILLESDKSISYYQEKLDSLEAQLKASMQQFQGANGKINNKEKYEDAVGSLPKVIKNLKKKIAAKKRFHNESVRRK